MEASGEGVAERAVPAFGPIVALIAPMAAAVRSFEDLTEVIGIHVPAVVFVAGGTEPSTS